MALDPNIFVIAPYLNSHWEREVKYKESADKDIVFDTGLNSVDENIWVRDIESGTVENPEHDIPESGIFRWTENIENTPNESEILDIRFENGLPFELNGQHLPLIEIVKQLNELGGKHGIGRFYGIEDNALYGCKNFEVKEAPAAHIIMSAHMELESVIFREGGILDEQEYSLKRYMDETWTTRVDFGHWYSHVTEALFLSIARLNEFI